MEAPYVPQRKQFEIDETIEDDWSRVFPHGEITEIGDTKFRAKMYPEDDVQTYWLVEASDALRMWPDDFAETVDEIEDVRVQFRSIGAFFR